MPLYIVVRHPRQPDQCWSNQWDPDNRGLRAFTTPNSVASEARAVGRVYVHRCGFGSDAPAIVCEAEVTAVHAMDRRDSLVQLRVLRTLDAVPPLSPGQGQNLYRAPAPE